MLKKHPAVLLGTGVTTGVSLISPPLDFVPTGESTIVMAINERHLSPLEGLSLEELVPEDNFYRRSESTVGLSFVRVLVEDRYASGGRPQAVVPFTSKVTGY